MPPLSLLLDSPLLPYIGIALLVLGVTAAGLMSFSTSGPLVVAYRNYIAWLERRRRTLYLKFVPAQIPWLQLAGFIGCLLGGKYYDERLYIGAPLSLVAPHLTFLIETKKRRRQIEEQTVTWLVMLTNSIKVTGSLADAFKQTLELTRGPLGQEIDLMLKEIQMGLTLPDAIRGMGERIKSEIFSTVLTVIMIGRSTGGELPKVLATTADSLRERFRLEGMLRKHTASARTQLIVLLCAPIAIYKGMQLVDAKFFVPFSESGLIGWILVGIIFLAWLIAAQMGRKILQVDM